MFFKKIPPVADLPKGFTVTCHAGAICTKPNTLHSVETAIKWGAQIVEFDVSFRPDGTPVIIHNSRPQADEGVLLKDALTVVAKSDSCKINLDIKSTANLGTVDELVKSNGLFHRVFYTGVAADWVKTVKENSEIPYYLNYNVSKEEAENKNAVQSIADKAKNLGAIGINSNFTNANSLFVDTVHENGLLVSLWTVNKPKDMLSVLQLGADNITTKKPILLQHIIGNL